MQRPESDKGRQPMNTRHREDSSPFSGIGEPRRGEVAITVLTALILLGVLVVVAVLG